MENKAPRRIKYKGQIYEAVESSNKGDFKVTFGQMDDELDHYINEDEDFDVFVSLDEIKQKIGEKALRLYLKGWTQEEADDLIEEFSEFKLAIKKVAYEKIPSYI